LPTPVWRPHCNQAWQRRTMTGTTCCKDIDHATLLVAAG
jgi:hypothetical protein